jgi:hypothetical protein
MRPEKVENIWMNAIQNRKAAMEDADRAFKNMQECSNKDSVSSSRYYRSAKDKASAADAHCRFITNSIARFDRARGISNARHCVDVMPLPDAKNPRPRMMSEKRDYIAINRIKFLFGRVYKRLTLLK